MSDVPKPSDRRQHDDGDGHAEAAERGTGDEQLQGEADDAERQIEGPEEPRERGGVAGEALVGDEAQLERRPLRRDRHEKHDRRHQAQVRTAGDLTHRIADGLTARG